MAFPRERNDLKQSDLRGKNYLGETSIIRWVTRVRLLEASSKRLRVVFRKRARISSLSFR
jgi:hypothetical protein